MTSPASRSGRPTSRSRAPGGSAGERHSTHERGPERSEHDAPLTPIRHLLLPGPAARQAAPRRSFSPMSVIADVRAREILDSRGNPTVEVEVDAGRRRHGPRGGALGRLHRRARGGRTARRRQDALRRQGRAEGGRGGQRRDLWTAGRPRRRGPAPIDRAADRARRHAEQVAARRQRHPRRVAGRRQGRGDASATCRSIATSAAARPTCCRCR